jgi:signal peptidase I
MWCRSPTRLVPAREVERETGTNPLPNCDRKRVLAEYEGGYVCNESNPEGAVDRGDKTFDVVPAGYYLMIGDNRDNSGDSREWGLVPDENVVGKATRIWFNFDPQRSTVINWHRIGQGID